MLKSCIVSFFICYKFIDKNSLLFLKYKLLDHMCNAILVVA